MTFEKRDAPETLDFRMRNLKTQAERLRQQSLELRKEAARLLTLSNKARKGENKQSGESEGNRNGN
jgi:hypothetical protein